MNRAGDMICSDLRSANIVDYPRLRHQCCGRLRVPFKRVDDLWGDLQGSHTQGIRRIVVYDDSAHPFVPDLSFGITTIPNPGSLAGMASFLRTNEQTR
jgi:hypothetical protein